MGATGAVNQGEDSRVAVAAIAGIPSRKAMHSNTAESAEVGTMGDAISLL